MSDRESDEDIHVAGETTFSPTATEDNSVRRKIRQEYRTLNQETRAKMDQLVETGAEEVKELIDRSNTLFSQVTMPREAALDSQQINLCAQILKRNAESVSANMTEFKPLEFAERLIAHLGSRIDDDTEEDLIPEENWISFGKEVMPMFKKAPSFHFLYGSLETNHVPTEQRRRAKAKDDEVAKAVVPKHLAEIQKSEQETTTEEVQRIFGILKALYAKHKEPLCYFSFITDPTSFTRTVENIFHVSFLVKDGWAGIALDEHKLPMIWPTRESDDDVAEKKETSQFIMSLTIEDWEDIVDSFKLTKPCIKPKRKPLATSSSENV